MNLHGKSILVTGAGGFIGSHLCQRIIDQEPGSLAMLNLTESGLYNLRKSLRTPCSQQTEVRFCLGSVTDERLVRHLLRGVDVVFHAAAHKHVPLCQDNPCQAILNNVGGTLTLVQGAWRAGVEKFVLISTDKAVRAFSIMGATKRVAEMIVQDFTPGYVVARFCNVLGASGSVVPLWQEQLAAGGPLTLTDPEATRYFITPERACDLVLGVLDFDRGTYLTDPGDPIRLIDLAQEMIQKSGKDCEIAITGLRPGDKLHEELYDGDRQATDHPFIFSVTPAMPHPGYSRLDDLLATAAKYEETAAIEKLWQLARA